MQLRIVSEPQTKQAQYQYLAKCDHKHAQTHARAAYVLTDTQHNILNWFVCWNISLHKIVKDWIYIVFHENQKSL